MSSASTSKMNNTWIIRLGRPEDRPLIYATWLRGLYYGNKYYKTIDQSAYFATYPKVLEHLLNNSSVQVACLSSDPDVVLGYVVYKGDTVHWIYVKRAWRGLGIAKSLFPPIVNIVSHLTDAINNKWRYIPFL